VFVPAEKRGVGMVFQSYALWPHMSVFDNIAYGLVLQGARKSAIREKVGEIIELVGLAGMAERFPSTLSGGQQQRVALARAAVVEPRILLLDEPLSNLDAKLREQMRGDLKSMIKHLQMTAVHITHDQHEAMGIADRIICMRRGRIEQEGSSRDLYRYPASRFIADFIGMATFIDGTVVRKGDSGRTLIRIAEGVELWSANAPPAGNGQDIVVSIRPENVILSSAPSEGENNLKGRIASETFFGSYTEYDVEIGGIRLKAHSLTDKRPDANVFVSIDPERVICVPRDGTSGGG
jgi:iron(III) transport system ATP-binding protein